MADDPASRMSERRRRRAHALYRTLAAIALGGILGALARYGLAVALPSHPGGFVRATFLINVTGCLLMGALMALLAARPTLPPLTQPFLGVGVLGGFTTFSTYILDVHQADSPGTTLLVLAATPLAALPAVWLGSAITEALLRRTGTTR